MKARAALSVAVLGGLLLCSVAPAWAHKTSLKTTLIGVIGSTSPIKFGSKTKALVSLNSNKGGTIKFKISQAVDGLGQKVTAANNLLVIETVVNGVPGVVQLPFDLKNGKGKASLPTLGLVSPDIIEIIDISLLDASNESFGTLGFRIKSGP